MKYSFY